MGVEISRGASRRRGARTRKTTIRSREWRVVSGRTFGSRESGNLGCLLSFEVVNVRDSRRPKKEGIPSRLDTHGIRLQLDDCCPSSKYD